MLTVSKIPQESRTSTGMSLNAFLPLLYPTISLYSTNSLYSDFNKQVNMDKNRAPLGSVYQRGWLVVGDDEARVWNNVRFEREAKKADRFE